VLGIDSLEIRREFLLAVDEVGKSPDTLSGERRDGFTHIRQARSTIRPLAGDDCFNSSVDRQVFGT
jgi:hypothetical protein